MLLKRLCEAAGVSSGEDEVRRILREELAGLNVTIACDSLGNLLVTKEAGTRKDTSKWLGARPPRVMIAAHMDEVGLMVTGFEKSGLLRFATVGGIDPRVLMAKSVVIGKDKVPGVIGAKAIHLQKPEEREKPMRVEELFIDIGAKDDKEAEKAVHKGDLAAFTTTFKELGYTTVMAKALDDRVGCAALVEALRDDYDITVCAAFTVQEEVGLRGAGVAAYSLEPDVALVVEGTTANDVTGVKEHEYSTTMGAGPAITMMDRSVIASGKVVDRLFAVAAAKGIPAQHRRSTAGGTDAGRIQIARAGIPTATIAVPCRYIHSPACIASLKDFEAAVALTKAFLHSIEESGVPA